MAFRVHVRLLGVFTVWGTWLHSLGFIGLGYSDLGLRVSRAYTRYRYRFGVTLTSVITEVERIPEPYENPTFFWKGRGHALFRLPLYKSLKAGRWCGAKVELS